MPGPEGWAHPKLPLHATKNMKKGASNEEVARLIRGQNSPFHHANRHPVAMIVEKPINALCLTPGEPPEGEVVR